jgi:arylsulfatase A-like enzyme
MRCRTDEARDGRRSADLRRPHAPRALILAAACSALVLSAGPSPASDAAASTADTKALPNIVLILADDLGYGDIGCYGAPDARTPTLDRLARQGVRFTSYYANAPECTPTRTALMTGRYQQRPGGLECAIGTGNVGRYDDAIRLAERGDLGLPAGQNVLVGGLRRAGYACAGFGKWHLGYEPKFGPLRHGFDYFFGPLGGGVDYFYHCEWDGRPMLYENQKPVRREGYMTDLITGGAVDFLARQTDAGPFFLYLPYTAPHTPIQAPGPKPPKPRTEENWNDGDRTTYVAMIERMDEGIGKVLAALDARGLRRPALAIFASDNGGTKLARNDPFSGQKGGLFEGGIRVPCIVRFPGVLPAGGVTDQPAIMMDFTRSILRVAAVEPPSDMPPDGIDILRLVARGGPPQPRTLFWRQRRGEKTWRAVRDGQWKYLSLDDGGQLDERLFDLAADPGEEGNLLGDRPEQTARLKRLLADWEKEVRPQR